MVIAYLDLCCIRRLTDDQSQARIRAEAEAVEMILAGVQGGAIALVASEALIDEMRRDPNLPRRVAGEAILALATTNLPIDGAIAGRAREFG